MLKIELLPNRCNPRITPSPVLKEKKERKRNLLVSEDVSIIQAQVRQNPVGKSYCWQG